MHEDKSLNEVEKIDTMMAFMDQDKFVSFATLIPHIEFVFPNQFNKVVECKFFFCSKCCQK